MSARIRLTFATLCLVFFLIPAASLYRELSGRSDIWWTPRTLLVPLADSKERVEIFARGKSLAILLQTGQLRIADDGASSVLATGDIGLRFNNWDRVRAERLPLLLGYAAACGITACLFVLVLTGRIAFRAERDG
jgi:hypothetical protein